ncbi:hypothetical protein DRP44_03060 [candidate division TA06 bacterium]|uniref:Protein FdhD n=1 Tax=candidate division TA06 bacterium TaxID=2250710 RepID=A0A660S9N6_UNCT6|nr:MAG: hypothetical protein DRP44_03060 [candidate division TA06 bacterium]
MKKRILRIFKDHEIEVDDDIIEESWITLNLNGRNYFRGIILNDAIEYFAMGFLKSEGVIKSKSDIKKLSIGSGVIDIKVKSRGKTPILPPFEKKKSISKDIIFQIGRDFDGIGELYKTTGGVHVCALYDEKGGLLFFFEDLSRRNAFDKVIGKAMKDEISLLNKIIITSGRMSSDIVYKVARSGISTIISKSAPTDLAIKKAREFKINMIGFLRGNRFNIYTNPELFLEH